MCSNDSLEPQSAASPESSSKSGNLSCAFPVLQIVLLPDAVKGSWSLVGLRHTGTEVSSLGTRIP